MLKASFIRTLECGKAKIVNVHLDLHSENSILQLINKLPEIDWSPSDAA